MTVQTYAIEAHAKAHATFLKQCCQYILNRSLIIELFFLIAIILSDHQICLSSHIHIQTNPNTDTNGVPIKNLMTYIALSMIILPCFCTSLYKFTTI